MMAEHVVVPPVPLSWGYFCPACGTMQTAAYDTDGEAQTALEQHWTVCPMVTQDGFAGDKGGVIGFSWKRHA